MKAEEGLQHLIGSILRRQQQNAQGFQFPSQRKRGQETELVACGPLAKLVSVGGRSGERLR